MSDEQHSRAILAQGIVETSYGRILAYDQQLQPMAGFMATHCDDCGDKTVVLFVAAEDREARVICDPDEAERFALKILEGVAILKGKH